jgi:hypothetical protein
MPLSNSNPGQLNEAGYCCVHIDQQRLSLVHMGCQFFSFPRQKSALPPIKIHTQMKDEKYQENEMELFGELITTGQEIGSECKVVPNHSTFGCKG